MTFEETRRLLQSLGAMRKHIDTLFEKLNRCEADRGNLTSPFGRTNTPIQGSGESVSSVVERSAERVMKAQEDYERAFTKYMELEDKLNAVVATLTIEEQDVIIECYMHGLPAWKVANKLYLSERTVKSRKHTAIDKISRSL